MVDGLKKTVVGTSLLIEVDGAVIFNLKELGLFDCEPGIRAASARIQSTKSME
jgi:hypothetical protein